MASVSSKASASRSQSHNPSASILIIGMRGSGKTFVGNIAAASLSWTFLDADTYFEDKLKMGVRQFVHDNGWEAFRAAETSILGELLAQRPTGHVISLGGGIVETPAARELLKAYANKTGPVVYIIRNMDEVEEYLGAETARPAYGEPIRDVFRRREPWFRECSSHELANHVGVPSTKTNIHDEVSRFFRHITGQQPNLAANVAPGRRSYFLSLTYPDITHALRDLDYLTEGADAIELRVDLLRESKDYESAGLHIPSRLYVSDQVAALRRATSLPIVFTVRTVSQGGSFPDTAEKEALDLLYLALRLGVEYVDVEITLPQKQIRELIVRKGSSQIIASWHDWSGKMKWNSSLVKEKYDIANELGDIIKIVGKATTIEDNFQLYQFVEKVKSQPQSKPIIAINMGLDGQMSRVLNSTFSPVTHPLLPIKAAPGQLSFKEIQTALNLLGLLPARQFYLFGTPITHSMSPILHNSGFEVLGLPHKYDLLESAVVGEEIKAAIAAPDFGGASVTIPHKLDIIPLLDVLSPAAQAIGAVNTIIPQALCADGSSRKLHGDNTDWLGIRDSISPKVQSIHAALVIGAGGTARAAIYALQALDAQVIYLHNRTTSKAQALALAFPSARIQVLEAIDEWPANVAPPNVIVSTVPSDAMTLAPGNGIFPLSSKLFDYRNGQAVVVDMAYRPAVTPLLKLAEETAANWVVVPGLEVLLAQGYVQFEKWTGRLCPKATVAPKVRSKYNES